jgi:FkbM family methyltransferase
MTEFTSQVGQDKWVCEKLGYKRHGYFLDIGANDGMWLSNSYYMEKELEWNGICVESNKTTFDILVKNRKCKCINKAIFSKNGEVEFASTGGYEGIKSCLQTEALNGTQVIMECVTMEKLLIDNNVPAFIDYVSIDTEGADYDVLLGFPFDKYSVGLWTIEHNAYMDGGILKAKIIELMTKNRYVVVLERDLPEKVNIFESWFVNDNHKK